MLDLFQFILLQYQKIDFDDLLKVIGDEYFDRLNYVVNRFEFTYNSQNENIRDTLKTQQKSKILN